MFKVTPAILTSDFSELGEMLSRCEGVVDRVQIDIIDGVFADNRTVDPSVLKEMDFDLRIDFQLMVDEPINWIERCVGVGTDRIFGHVEMMSDQIKFVEKVVEARVGIGLALDLKTPISEFDQKVLTKLDAVLLMSVKAGFGGQKFDPLVLPKVIELNRIREKDKTPFKICVDGGVTLENVGEIVKAGADEVSVGRRLFMGDLAGNIDRYLKAIENK